MNADGNPCATLQAVTWLQAIGCAIAEARERKINEATNRPFNQKDAGKAAGLGLNAFSRLEAGAPGRTEAYDIAVRWANLRIEATCVPADAEPVTLVVIPSVAGSEKKSIQKDEPLHRTSPVTGDTHDAAGAGRPQNHVPQPLPPSAEEVHLMKENPLVVHALAFAKTHAHMCQDLADDLLEAFYRRRGLQLRNHDTEPQKR